MARYQARVLYDMNFSSGSEIIEFEAENDQAARQYAKKLNGSDLSPIKRDVRVEQLTRVVE